MPLDEPGWSLFFELVANLMFVRFYRYLTNAALVAIVGVSLAALFVLYLKGGGFGGSNWSNFFWGFPRVSYSFFLGVIPRKIAYRQANRIL